jgi:hypothetical protein
VCFLAAGFLQDPLRKLETEHSVYFVLGAGIVFSFVMISAWSRLGPRPSVIFANDRQLEQAWKLFFLVCVLQMIHTFVRWGNLYLVALGFISYFLPIGALLLGCYYARSMDNVERFLKTYCAIAVPWALTVYLSYWFGGDWDVLRDMGWFFGKELRIYDLGTVLRSNPGLFRVGEIAAWHAATAAALLIAFSMRRTTTFSRLLFAVLVVALIGAIVLTGRRKMLVTIIIFAGSYSALLVYLRHGLTRNVFFLVLAAACGALIIVYNEPDTSQLLYVRHSVSVFEQLVDRGILAINLFFSGLWKFDLIGAGAGVSAQGSQYFGGGVAIVGGSAESGLGKISTELGLPGLIAIVVLGSVLMRQLLRGARYASICTPHWNEVIVALLSLLIANMATFFVATQVYGDTFILLLLGFFTGFLLVAPWLAHRESLRA